MADGSEGVGMAVAGGAALLQHLQPCTAPQRLRLQPRRLRLLLLLHLAQLLLRSDAAVALGLQVQLPPGQVGLHSSSSARAEREASGTGLVPDGLMVAEHAAQCPCRSRAMARWAGCSSAQVGMAAAFGVFAPSRLPIPCSCGARRAVDAMITESHTAESPKPPAAGATGRWPSGNQRRPCRDGGVGRCNHQQPESLV